jgi:DNA-directed RNA polymerase subunit RPC12/RpoP
MLIESCCIVVVFVVIVFVVLFLFTNRDGSKQEEPPSPSPPDYIATYKCSHCGLNFVQPLEIERNGSTISVCPECKKEIT